MLAEQALHEGNLDETLASLQDQVRKDPSNAKLRVFLFQLLALLGQWDRAMNQLNVAGDLDAARTRYAEAVATGVHGYLELYFARHRLAALGGPP